MPMVANATFLELSGAARRGARASAASVRTSSRIGTGSSEGSPLCVEARKFKRRLPGLVLSLKISAAIATLCLPRNVSTERPDHRFVPGGS
jgi:hypothetical protein